MPSANGYSRECFKAWVGSARLFSFLSVSLSFCQVLVLLFVLVCFTLLLVFFRLCVLVVWFRARFRSCPSTVVRK